VMGAALCRPADLCRTTRAATPTIAATFSMPMPALKCVLMRFSTSGIPSDGQVIGGVLSIPWCLKGGHPVALWFKIRQPPYPRRAVHPASDIQMPGQSPA
jgi:hypothetical protein